MSTSVCIAMTGASGVQYGLRLLQVLLAAKVETSVLISKAAHVVIATETPYKLAAQPQKLQQQLLAYFTPDADLYAPYLTVYGREDWFAPVASGSGAPESLVICPCSGGTLSAIATGASNNLIERAADVALKERRQLILVPREAPYHQVHLEHMLKLTQMGALILPASPGFYHQPQCIEDLIDFIVARILDHLGLQQDLMPKWGA
ncbi:4-hydroxy-3-polyprenylbenzoate decarboxylase [Allopseudospirillum japonicum]|uniref:Flavin prenyltransferase UbiX n=1 Tax=Allopseudospirillum japonicum TaxID=64971 RepID=A0A1H6QXA2_9GAMM|nr:flavin prenyltransferase UbiX [Allopseudospirillum japonicum]SEI48398.1 4-hydroxy-3-polyprenylbenzoate decarboxylase [Allopseudospirillum japonicum]